jgi:23S rRNA (adenine2503-C2)-methyltransferase
MNVPQPSIHACHRDDLLARFTTWQQPTWRVGQLLDWLYVKRVGTWDAMSNLPLPLRQRLAETYSIDLPQLTLSQGARDTTRKFLWKLRDGALIESVLIPANPALYGERADRTTLCVSTQVGCAYGCKFCASGLEGWRRNLDPDEIVGQVLALEQNHRAEPVAAAATEGAGEKPEAGGVKPARSGTSRLIDNLVIMGMGEPLANYDNLLRALRILNAPWGGGIGARKITLSTSGLAPQIRRLAGEPEQFRLAISLHGATDEVRNRIMPVNRKYPIAELSSACAEYLERKGKMITFEYILLAGVNDAPDHARPLAELARRLHAKINLIPYNAVEGLEWKRPTDAECQAFAARVTQFGALATLRLEKGHDIEAACGQLRLKTEKELTKSDAPGSRENPPSADSVPAASPGTAPA